MTTLSQKSYRQSPVALLHTYQQFMRTLFIASVIASLSSLSAQETVISPTEELRTHVSEWVETMRKIQIEENDWARDQEVLTNYKEGLEKEISDLNEKIAEAKTKKQGADTESFKQIEEKNRLVAAKDELAKYVRSLEEKMLAKLPLIPAPLRAEPKISQAIEDLERDIKLPEEKRSEGVSKRLLNLINLTAEVEKFQQTVVLRQELRKDQSGREFNMDVIYFGLSMAYAVNEEGSLALMAKPTEKEGWKFVERKDLASDIQKLIRSTKGDTDPAFITLPISQ